MRKTILAMPLCTTLTPSADPYNLGGQTQNWLKILYQSHKIALYHTF